MIAAASAKVEAENATQQRWQDRSWANKYSLVSPWFDNILHSIKRDCKTEHLSIDPHFVRTHFAGKPVHRISLEEMRAVYLQQILAGHERLAEFVANRWLFRNMEIYRFFEKGLEQSIPNFDKIDELPFDICEELLQKAKEQYGIETVFCFTVLNDVALPPALFEKIQKEALNVASENAKRDLSFTESEEKQLHLLKQEMQRIKERHEKKIEELQKRHRQEVDRMSREIVVLREEIKKVQKNKKESH